MWWIVGLSKRKPVCKKLSLKNYTLVHGNLYNQMLHMVTVRNCQWNNGIEFRIVSLSDPQKCVTGWILIRVQNGVTKWEGVQTHDLGHRRISLFQIWTFFSKNVAYCKSKVILRVGPTPMRYCRYVWNLRASLCINCIKTKRGNFICCAPPARRWEIVNMDMAGSNCDGGGVVQM